MKNNNYVLKSIAALFLAALFAMPASAQQDEEVSTLFGSKNGSIDHGGWAALTFGYTQIEGKDTYLMGARGGWLINHRFTIGLSGNGFISDQDYFLKDYNYNPVNIAGGYGGLLLEANIMPFYPVHITIPVIIGAGGITYTNQKWWEGNDYDEPASSIDSDAFFVLEPGLEVEINLISFMRLALGGSYRYTSNVSLINTDGDLLRGFNGYFGLKFGWF
jgi:hypothetical protein